MVKNEQDDLLSRLASKAKKKLNKQVAVDERESMVATYEFIKGNLSDQEKKLEKKVIQLLKNYPDCVDPIGKLIERSVYDKLSEERKQAYIFKLSRSYALICERLAN